VVTRVLRNVAPGAILLLHEGPLLPPEIRVDAIRRTLKQLDGLHLRCVVPEAEQLVD